MGTATFFHPNSPAPWFMRPLHRSPAQPGQASESLDLVTDLSTVPTSGASVALAVGGLPDPMEAMAKFTVPFALVPSEEVPPLAARASSPRQMYPTSTEEVHYFPIAGFYRLTSDTVVWVAGPGYYYVASVQYYRYVQPTFASSWVPARRAPDPVPAQTAARMTEAPESIHPELYWRPKAFADTESYRLWLRGEMRRQQLAGRSPATMDGECARCHQR
jgi:hypothetical protein